MELLTTLRKAFPGLALNHALVIAQTCPQEAAILLEFSHRLKHGPKRPKPKTAVEVDATGESEAKAQ